MFDSIRKLFGEGIILFRVYLVEDDRVVKAKVKYIGEFNEKSIDKKFIEEAKRNLTTKIEFEYDVKVDYIEYAGHIPS